MPLLIYMILVFLFLVVYIWSIYNLPILVAGVRHLRRSRRKPRKALLNELPTFSIIVPVKNEEKVIGRLLDALARLDYPADKKEIIVVEDGSTDRTSDVCLKCSEESSANLRVLHKPLSSGKPSALNFGIEHARGEIIGVFDADSLPAEDSLLNVCKYFEDPHVTAVQGRTLSINSEQNMLTKFLSYEEAVYFEAYLRGKDALGLFVHLRGSCQFIRRDSLQELKGFDEGSLSEDMEISARLTDRGCLIRYAPDVRAWQESPAGLKQLLRQRTRWFRGTMEVAFKYGRLMAKRSKKSFDAEATLFGPFILIASLVTYFAAFYSVLVPLSVSLLLQFFMQSTTLIVTLSIFLCGLALIYSSKPRKASRVMWLPFIYFYWSLQVFIALYAVLLMALHKPRTWSKTEKSGVVTTSNVQQLE
jgi:cellulose synthase/poly-beta-1,6-N-acetylglucosamine synthase-like glycosyltransferase